MTNTKPGDDEGARVSRWSDGQTLKLKIMGDILYPRLFGRRWVSVLLHAYTLALGCLWAWDTGTDFTPGVYVVIGVTVACVEVLNQVTYHLAKSRPKKSLIIKFTCFWLLFTAATGVYAWLVRSRWAVPHASSPWISRYVLAFVLYYGFIYYSVSTEVRFLFLGGRFRGLKDTPDKLADDFEAGTLTERKFQERFSKFTEEQRQDFRKRAKEKGWLEES